MSVLQTSVHVRDHVILCGMFFLFDIENGYSNQSVMLLVCTVKNYVGLVFGVVAYLWYCKGLDLGQLVTVWLYRSVREFFVISSRCRSGSGFRGQ